jgi:hypothetical protein
MQLGYVSSAPLLAGLKTYQRRPVFIDLFINLLANLLCEAMKFIWDRTPISEVTAAVADAAFRWANKAIKAALRAAFRWLG